jgi:hypothetical protein
MREFNREIAKPVLVADHPGITQQGLDLLMAIGQ